MPTSNTQNSPFRQNRKPTTLNQYAATGRMAAPQPNTTASTFRSGATSQQSPTPTLNPQGAAGSRFQTVQQPSSPMTYNPAPPPAGVHTAGVGGGMQMGAGPDTRASYLQSQNRLGGGDYAFGFGEMARRRISDAARMAAMERNLGVPTGQTVMPQSQQLGVDPNFQQRAAQIQGLAIRPAYSDFQYGDDAVPVASGGGGSSSPFGGEGGGGGGGYGQSRSGLTAAGKEEVAGGSANEPPPPRSVADVYNDPNWGDPPRDTLELARRLEQEGNTVAAARLRALVDTWDDDVTIEPDGTILIDGQPHGNIDDSGSWDEFVQRAFTSQTTDSYGGDGTGRRDYTGDNNLLETGREQRDRVAEGLNLNDEQQSWQEALGDAGFYVTETGKIKDLDGNEYGSIYSREEVLGRARNILKPIWDAADKAKGDSETAGAVKAYEEYQKALGGPPDATIDVEGLLQAQNERRALDRAREMRASMEMASRAGMSPEASIGLSQGMMQQSALGQREAEEKTRLSARMQEIESGIQFYKMKADMLMQAAQMQASKEMQEKMMQDAALARNQAAKLEQDRFNAQLEAQQWQAIGGGVGNLAGMGLAALIG